MALTESFHYKYGESSFHRFDERFKIVLMLCFCSAATAAGQCGLAFGAAVLVLLFIVSRITLVRILVELSSFWLLLAFVFLFHAYSVEGTRLIEGAFFLPSIEGIVSGARLVFRFSLVILAGAFFTATTRATRLTAASGALLRRVPFVPAALLSTMMGLTLMFVPVLLDIFREVSDAVRSRCGDAVRHPVKRIVSFAIPLFVRVFTHTDEIALAMEARCFTGEYTPHEFRARPVDYALFCGGIVVCAAMIAIDIFVR